MFHPATEILLASLRDTTPGSLLLTGRTGVGLYDAARAIATTPSILTISPDSAAKSRIISVETIRELYTQTHSMTTTKQFVIINEADAMSGAAQTAFLKLLEEPATNVHFILLSHHYEQLLPTIRSRTQQHHIQPISAEQSQELLNALGVTDTTKRQQLLFMAEGLSEELVRLANDEEYFTQAVGRMKDARELLQASVYEKLRVAARYKDRAQAIDLVRNAIAITKRSLSQYPEAAHIKQLNKLLDAEVALQANQSVKLVLASFVL